MIARGLPPTANCHKINDKLQQRKLFCKDPVNIIKKNKIEADKGGNIEMKETVKTPLPLFMLAFDCKENIKTVFGINKIQGATVKIVLFRKPNLIPQCKRGVSYMETCKNTAKDSQDVLNAQVNT
jgi:hypothetical protein